MNIFRLLFTILFLFSFTELETIVLDWLGESAFKNFFFAITREFSHRANLLEQLGIKVNSIFL